MRASRRMLFLIAFLFGLGGFNWACTDLPSGPGLDEPVPERSSVATGLEIAEVVRTGLGQGIAHYTYDLVLGPGEFDVVRLHRVVKERQANSPARTVDGVFLLPGYPNSWVQIFVEPLISSVPAWDHSVAIFLARNGVDVWGIDYAWALVPRQTTDFGFMADWGIQRDVNHAHEALAAAQSIRVADGQGKGRLQVLGFSYGVPVAYGILGLETLLPPGRRLAKGLIAVDNQVKVEDAASRAAACEGALAGQAAIDAGTYHGTTGVFLKAVGDLAESDPEGTSPFAAGLTNWQFALYAGAVGKWHFVAGYFDDVGIPTGLRFTDPGLWIDLLQAGPPFTPLQAGVDTRHAKCGSSRDVLFDDHLEGITVPILALNAAGGIGGGAYTASLTATEDFSEITVQLLSDGERELDFGHGDLFTAANAEALVWHPILEWILTHRENRTYPKGGNR